jgi:hypothetical protein
MSHLSLLNLLVTGANYRSSTTVAYSVRCLEMTRGLVWSFGGWL